MNFDTFVIVDWSGGNDRGKAPKPDAIWACIAGQEPIYFRNRQLVEVWLASLFETELAAGRRVLGGFDFPFGYPVGFSEEITGVVDPFALWAWFAAQIKDDPKSNNRFDVAGEINKHFDGIGPFWGNGLTRDIDDLPRKGNSRTALTLPEKREVENLAKGSFTCWQLSGAGAVGSQVMMGLPVLHRLREKFDRDVAVWPFEETAKPITIVEVWPSMFAGKPPAGMIKDAHQVQVTAEHFKNMPAAELKGLFAAISPQEGWILGVMQPKSKSPPPLRNDCFAMPRGVEWTPVETALEHLRSQLSVVATSKNMKIAKASNRILAVDVKAARSHPPTPNSAVDGYAFAGAISEGEQSLKLLAGRSAAGAPYCGSVAHGQALRILTGAALPEGVDTVILQEDVIIDGDALRFRGPLKQGANARAAGEDLIAGQIVFPKGRKLTPWDLGTLTACGVGQVSVHKKLRVGILSTGDELAQAGEQARDDQIYDANRPMLSAVVRKWGHKVIDLGCAPDDREELRQMLNEASERCDVILSSGGASAGDEDHMSALLADTGTFALWRIAMKPGRPLALGVWGGTPVFGLPGNPVAALVCALVFARPALAILAGGTWLEPEGFMVPAGFSKSKKPGRREYIRARIEDGMVMAFGSEGSGRVSGLSWATGLVEFGNSGETIAKGDLVRFIPYESFGL